MPRHLLLFPHNSNYNLLTPTAIIPVVHAFYSHPHSICASSHSLQQCTSAPILDYTDVCTRALSSQTAPHNHISILQVSECSPSSRYSISVLHCLLQLPAPSTASCSFLWLVRTIRILKWYLSVLTYLRVMIRVGLQMYYNYTEPHCGKNSIRIMELCTS
jgi:hypothetical protein